MLDNDDRNTTLRNAWNPSGCMLGRPAIVDMWVSIIKNQQHIVVLHGDAGIGKTHFLDCIDGYESRIGAQVRRVSFDGCSESELAARFARFSRESVKYAEGSPRLTVCIDDLPVADERTYAKVARGIRRMVGQGCFVAVAIRPECEGLLECLDKKVLIGANELVRGTEAASENDLQPRLTNYVPKLVLGLESDVKTFGKYDGTGASYATALREMVRTSLRETLMVEEVETRLGMILLGEGSFDDVVRICRHADSDSFELLESEAPFFGVEREESLFRIAGLCETSNLSACGPDIARLATEHEETFCSSADILARRGEFFRMGVVLGMLPNIRVANELVIKWGVELVSAGHLNLVSRVMRLEEEAVSGDANAVAEPLKRICLINNLAIAEMSGKRREVDDLRARVGELGELSTEEALAMRRVQLLGASRDVLAGNGLSNLPSPSNMDDASDVELCEHVTVVDRLINGRLLDGFDLLLDNPLHGGCDDIPTAMLADDTLICECLLGEALGETGEVSEAAVRRVLAESGSGRLLTLHRATMDSLRILMGRKAAFPDIDRTLAMVHETGDVVPEVVFLLAAAVADLRMKALARASVRVGRAATLAKKAAVPYLVAATDLMDTVVQVTVGEEMHVTSGRGKPADRAAAALLDLRRMLAQASRGEVRSAVRLDALARSTCSREVLWALNILINDCGRASQNFRELMPVPWLRFATSVLQADGGMADSASDGGAPGEKGKEPSRRDGKPVRIRIMGTFLVSVDGVELPAKALGPRRGRNLVYALALAKGHSLSKRDAIAIVWGDYDYQTGTQKLYESVCMVRKVVKSAESKEPLVLTGRGSGRISLDVTRVAFDVDEFEECASKALASEGADRKAIAFANKARSLYSSGVTDLFDDPSGLTSARIDALKALHTDAMAAGAQAALREGKTYLSTQFSNEALADDPLREDAVVGCATAMGVLGRTAEIVTIYRRYKDTLLHRLHARPSVTIRKAVDEALGRSGSDLTSEEIDRIDEEISRG